MERGFDGKGRRRFDAPELYLLSVVFDVPIAYFFIPPPAMKAAELADSRRPIAEVWRSMPRSAVHRTTRSRSKNLLRPHAGARGGVDPC